MTGGARPWPEGENRVGQQLLTPAQARRLRAATRFSVGGGVRLGGLNPARPAPGDAVVIVDRDRHVRGAAVLTDLGRAKAARRFALWVPASDAGPDRVSSFAELSEMPWLLVEAGLWWNDVVEILSPTTVTDVADFERSHLVLNPVTGARVSMIRFVVPDPPPVPATPAPVSRPPAGADLATAVQILASVKEAYAAYECDHRRVLAAPALADVGEDATGAFVEAFQLAVALEPERPERCPPAHAARFVAAVLAAETAWEAAEAHAHRLGVAGYDPAERTRIRRARQALDLALRADTPAAEREASLAAARRLLDGLVMLPAALETVIAGAVTAAPARAALDH